MERILDAAVEEFATRGYEAASTNLIASKAGVAKGLVFHHFGSKEGLLEALFDRELGRLSGIVFSPFAGSTELFERLHQLTMRKLELAARHPLSAEFLEVALTEAPPSLSPKLLARQAQLLKSAWPRVLEGLDGSKLRAGLTLGDAVETVSLMSEGLEKQLLALSKSRTVTMAELSARAWRHFERLRDGLYR
ncbi:MAG: TetR/AcrR family transcriptional regulator [Archangiaceae bacterium]|nr:TetR/AcrR family transcriptional regulator [Archangiaceae bacterium]